MKTLFLALMLCLVSANSAHAQPISVSCVHTEKVKPGRSAIRHTFFLEWESETRYATEAQTLNVRGDEEQLIKSVKIDSSEHRLHCELRPINGSLVDCMGGNPTYPVFARIDSFTKPDRIELSMQTIYGATFNSFDWKDCTISQ